MELESFIDFDCELDFGKTYESKSGTKGTWIVEGFASTSDLDAQNHIVSPEAIAMGAESLKKYDTVLFNHDPNMPIGKVVDSSVQDGKLFIKVAVSKTEPKIWEQIKDGTLNKFSIRGKILDASNYNDPHTQKDIIVIKGMELHEVSLVSVPANPNARSIGWYIQKAFEKAAYFKTNATMNDCMSRRMDVHKGNGVDHTQALVLSWAECAKAHGMHKDLLELDFVKDLLEKKNYRLPGESMRDCVSRKIHINVHEKNMPHDQAVAVAMSECGAKKDMDANEDEIQKKKYDWSKCISDQKARGYSDQVAAKICAAIKNRTIAHMVEEWGMAVSPEEAIDKVCKKMENDKMYEYAWDRFVALQDSISKSQGDCGCMKKSEDIQKDQKSITSAIKSLEVSLGDLQGDDKDQVQVMIRSLQALIGRVYQKSIDDNKGGQTVDEKTEVKKEATEEVKEEVKKADKEPQKIELDVSALTQVITQLQDMVKSVTTQSDEVKVQLGEVTKAKDEITQAKTDIAKALTDLNAVLKEIPLRKGAPAEKEEDRTKETVVKKDLSEDEDFQKAKPADQLHKLISAHIAN